MFLDFQVQGSLINLIIKTYDTTPGQLNFLNKVILHYLDKVKINTHFHN